MKHKHSHNFLYFFLILLVLGLVGSIPADAQNSNNYFKNGKLHVVSSSHQDIAWMDTPEACIQFRDEHMITPVLKRMAESPTFCFSVEDGLSLKEYLHRHPESYQDILKYTRQGRLEWGATYKQPYFSLYDGEALIRQAYFGRKWLKKTLPGCDFKTAWNQDVPAMAMQYPQILAKSGIPYYQFSRHQPGLYRWYSPDGSSILGWTPGQYECSGRPIRAAKTDAARTDTFKNQLSSWENYYAKRQLANENIFLYSYDFSTPLNWDQYMTDWNKQVKLNNVLNLPYIQYATGTMALEGLDKAGGAIDKLAGERPNVWLYIHGPTHHRAITAARVASRILTAAEKFASMNALLENSFSNYPQSKLTQAWDDAIYPDHGWGGKNGHITDYLFRTKFESARDSGRAILETAISNIAQKIKFNQTNESEFAISVFNPLSWNRSDPVSFTLDVDNRTHTHFQLIDASGKEVPYQLDTEHNYPGNRDEVLSFQFIAEDVPAMGYKTYYLVPKRPTFDQALLVTDQTVYENQYYKLKLGNGGIQSLFDKELNTDVFQVDKFMGAEVFNMHSEGFGAGEFTSIQKPTMEGFEKMSQYTTNWQCVASGAVKDVFQTTRQMKDAVVNIRLIMYKTLKRIDVVLDINGFSGDNWREFRLAFPTNISQSQIAYEVPMGVVEVGKSEIAGAAGFSKPEQIYSDICKDVHPREVQDWFCAYNNNKALTISSSVAVFDWVDPTSQPVNYPVLQPILLASRKSCHGEGNYYLQPGNHHYTFSIYSHKGNWKNGYRLGTQSNQALQVVISKPKTQEGHLPESFNFASINGKGMIISTIKKCDDDNSLILRCYDIEGNKSNMSFNLFKDLRQVEHTNMIEEEGQLIQSKGKGFDQVIGAYSIETYKLIPNTY